MHFCWYIFVGETVFELFRFFVGFENDPLTWIISLSPTFSLYIYQHCTNLHSSHFLIQFLFFQFLFSSDPKKWKILEPKIGKIKIRKTHLWNLTKVCWQHKLCWEFWALSSHWPPLWFFSKANRQLLFMALKWMHAILILQLSSKPTS